MTTSTLTSKGQVTIPKEIRDALGLKEHDRVSFVRRGDDVIIKPIKDIIELRGSVKPKKRPENYDEVRRTSRKDMVRKVIPK